MSKFEENVNQHTPRLVVTFKSVRGNETFQWGIVGNIPMLTIIGAIARVQQELFTVLSSNMCPEPALVITWDEKERTTDWYIHSNVPLEPLAGMLELIKAGLVASHMARGAAMASKGAILGPDGRPMMG